MVDDPDAIWRPGYDGPTPTVESDTDGSHEPSPELLSEPESPACSARSRWWFGVGVIIVGALALVVGDRILARATSIDGQLRISAYGDAD